MKKSVYNDVLRRATGEIPNQSFTSLIHPFPMTLSVLKMRAHRKGPGNESCFYSSPRFIVICDYDLSNRRTEKEKQKKEKNNSSNSFRENKQITIISFASCFQKQVFGRRVCSWARIQRFRLRSLKFSKCKLPA